jgi:hypothetical protein
MSGHEQSQRRAVTPARGVSTRSMVALSGAGLSASGLGPQIRTGQPRTPLRSQGITGRRTAEWCGSAAGQGWAQTPELDFLPEEGCKKEGGVSKYGGRAEGGVPK